jgi:ribosomal protein S27E
MGKTAIPAKQGRVEFKCMDCGDVVVFTPAAALVAVECRVCAIPMICVKIVERAAIDDRKANR